MSTSTPKPIRSPAYPAVPLRDAISNVKKIEAAYRRSSVDREAAAKLIGYSGLSGPANKTLAALAQYGLVERAGKGEMRVTALAQAVLHPDNDAEKRKALRDAAFGSGLFHELQERWPNMVPPEDGVITYLNRQGFNQSAIKPAARAYLQTLALLEEAGASESHGLEERAGADSALPDEGGGGDHPNRTFGGAAVGDLVQWKSQGVLQFETPKRVRLVTDDGQWIAVDDSETGIPMNEVMVEQRAAPTSPPPPRFQLGQTGPEPVAAGMRTAMIPLDEGDVKITFPAGLSPDSFELLSDYLDLFFRKEKRAADKAKKGGTHQTPEGQGAGSSGGPDLV